MVEKARARLSPVGGRVEYAVADLAAPIPENPPATRSCRQPRSTGSWITMRCSRTSRRSFGWAELAAQCGGGDNIASIEAALHGLGEGFEGRKHYASVEDVRTRLERAGFTDVETWLHDEPTELEPEDVEAYLATICLGDHVEGWPTASGNDSWWGVARRLPGPRIDYVRLNIRARRAA